MIWLLDLNYTLVENSSLSDLADPDIAAERYRGWLVDALREDGGTVLLVTWRARRHQAATLARIAEELGGWQPDGVYFNPGRMLAPVWKQKALQTDIMPRYGDDPRLYFGLESNPRTRAAYADLGVGSCRVPKTPQANLLQLIASCQPEPGSLTPK